MPKLQIQLHYQDIIPSNGVVMLSGYGVKVTVDKQHLLLEDGVADERRKRRFPRIHHDLSRVVVLGSEGYISFDAMRWMADQKIAFVVLEWDGSTSLATGPISASDVRLRRAQACVKHSPNCLSIVRELIRVKMFRQEHLVRERISNPVLADKIVDCLNAITSAETIDAVRQIEGQASISYWIA